MATHASAVDQYQRVQIQGVSSADDSTALNVQIDPITQEVLVKASIGSIPLVSTAIVGQTKVAVTGTAVQLPSNALTNGVIITAYSTNATPIVIGGLGVTNTITGAGNGYILEAGGSVSAAITNTNVLYINGTANDFVSFIGS